MKKNQLNKEELFSTGLSEEDRKTFKAIFNAYYKRLYAFALRYVESKHAAEDIVEGVLLVLWQKRHKMHNVENLKSYLYAMVRNASLDYLKKKKKLVRLELKKHDSMTMMEQFIIEEETHAILFQALETLPPKSRKVFELSCLEGMKYKDIADELNISLNTVKSQRSRAIELLKVQLKDYPFFQLFLAAL
ncbi:RNA polymerase sigma-70 factor [Gaetbulibacter sp. M240]|uniref:RNA polymerase sigma-70 factor n=1 Tax=Gaetbulibacter sp. M240 TaxID=3126511 RepID=UPI00374E81B5